MPSRFEGLYSPDSIRHSAEKEMLPLDTCVWTVRTDKITSSAESLAWTVTWRKHLEGDSTVLDDLVNEVKVDTLTPKSPFYLNLHYSF